MRREPDPPRALMLQRLYGLAESWAGEAGMSVQWAALIESDAMLTQPCPTKRALWRCARQMARLLAEDSGCELAELPERLGLEPVEQYAKAPGG